MPHPTALTGGALPPPTAFGGELRRGAPAAPRPPVTGLLVQTTDPAVAHDAIRELYGDHRLRPPVPGGGLRFEVRAATAGGIGIDRLRYSAAAQIDIEPGSSVAVPLVLGGRMTVRTPREELRLGPGRAVLFSSDEPLGVGWEDLDALVLRLSPESLRAVAGAAGIDPYDLRFDGMRTRSGELLRYLRDTMSFLYRQLHAPDPSFLSPMLLAELSRLAATAVLAGFPNTSTAGESGAPGGRVAPVAVRRAVQYIETHADEPIMLGDVAAAAGVTARALQHGFARYHGTTPMGYLRRVRLERAHNDLVTADPTRGATVHAIARRWGFANASRFSQLYREVYGRRPAETLRT